MNDPQIVRMRRIWPIVGLAFLAACLLIVLSVYLYFFPWYTDVKVSGIVVDGATGEPVPNAKLILTLQRWGFPYNAMIAKYGITSDEKGLFSIDHTPHRRFNDVMIEVSSPSNLYGRARSYGVVKDIEIGVSPTSESTW